MAITVADATRNAQNKAFEAFVAEIACVDLGFEDVNGVARDFNLSRQSLQSRMRLARRLAAFFRWSVIDGIKRCRIADIAASRTNPFYAMRTYEYITKERFVQPMIDIVHGLFWVDMPHRRSTSADIKRRRTAMHNALLLLREYTAFYGNDACRALIDCINKSIRQ